MPELMEGKVDKYIIKLDKQQLDIIMKALGELPLKESLPVFNEINGQYIEQIQIKDKEA